ncbi:hypothetical protein P692DRAFT_20870193 [Suillus brevipes Sb2]|nr:hypothetical protein P692DRAFT_20870193 [Suillus brevipes Sb2]
MTTLQFVVLRLMGIALLMMVATSNQCDLFSPFFPLTCSLTSFRPSCTAVHSSSPHGLALWMMVATVPTYDSHLSSIINLGFPTSLYSTRVYFSHLDIVFLRHGDDDNCYCKALPDPDSITKSLEATIPRAVLSSGAQYNIYADPPVYRHLSQLRTADLTDETFQSYLKHYMQHGFGNMHHIEKWPLTSPPDIQPNEMHRTDTSASRGPASTPPAFTLSHLCRVPELALLASWVTNTETRRRTQSDTDVKRAGPAQKSSLNNHRFKLWEGKAVQLPIAGKTFQNKIRWSSAMNSIFKQLVFELMLHTEAPGTSEERANEFLVPPNTEPNSLEDYQHHFTSVLKHYTPHPSYVKIDSAQNMHQQAIGAHLIRELQMLVSEECSHWWFTKEDLQNAAAVLGFGKDGLPCSELEDDIEGNFLAEAWQTEENEYAVGGSAAGGEVSSSSADLPLTLLNYKQGGAHIPHVVNEKSLSLLQRVS